MKIRFALFLFFTRIVFLQSTDTFDDDGLNFIEISNNTVKNETDTEGDFFDITIVETDELI
jgi:hypothetical protein